MLPVLQAYMHRNTGVLHVGRRANNLLRRSVGLSGRMDLTVVVPGIGTNCPEVSDLAFCIEISNVGIEAPKQQVLRQEGRCAYSSGWNMLYKHKNTVPQI